LGHQAIGEAFGGKLVNLSTVFHGVATPVKKVKRETPDVKAGDVDLFEGLPEEFEVGRYHSWIVSEEGFPEELEVTAKDEQGYIMALQHKRYDVRGVQFHPESVLTPQGEVILRNWLKS
jgi:anthranilate synthase component 2